MSVIFRPLIIVCGIIGIWVEAIMWDVWKSGLCGKWVLTAALCGLCIFGVWAGLIMWNWVNTSGHVSSSGPRKSAGQTALWILSRLFWGLAGCGVVLLGLRKLDVLQSMVGFWVTCLYVIVLALVQWGIQEMVNDAKGFSVSS